MVKEAPPNVRAAFEMFCQNKNLYRYLGSVTQYLSETYKPSEFKDLQELASKGQVLKMKPKARRKSKGVSTRNEPKCTYFAPTEQEPDAYLHLHAYRGRINKIHGNNITEASVIRLISGTFDTEQDCQDALQFITNNNHSLLITRRKYTSKSAYDDEPVALLTYTRPTKAVLYIAFAAVSKGQGIEDGSDGSNDKTFLPSPQRDNQDDGYVIPTLSSGKPLPNGFDRRGVMTVLVNLMMQGTAKFKKLRSPILFCHVTDEATK